MKKKFIVLSLLIIFLSQLVAEDEKNATEIADCLEIENTVCVSNGMKFFAKDNLPKDLIGHWTFDEKYSLDHSKARNHLYPSPVAGPQSGGKGYSAYYDGVTYSNISHNKIYETEDMTICFWIFLLKDSTGSWRTILHKGDTSKDLTPTIMLWPKERRLHVRVSTDQNANEGLDSKSVIPLKRWTHLTISFSSQLLHLYINGMIDNEVILKGSILHNKGNFNLGKDPWHLGTMMYLDDFRIYSTILKIREIKILSAPTMNLWAEDFAMLGCDSCNFNQALNSCSENYHLCSIKELYAGGYHVARIMGWFRLNTEIWTRDYEDNESNKNEMLDPNIYKMAVCCALK